MLLLPLIAMLSHPVSVELTMYVGTYTDAAGSKGIYRVTLNPANGSLSEAKLAAETTAPSYLAIRPDGKSLYSVNEYSTGEASAYAIENGALRKLNTVKFDGGGPCHVTTDVAGKWLFVAAYGGGALSVFPLLPDGTIGAATDTFKNEGSGPNKKRQERPHLHFAATAGKFVYACDLGTDEVLSFSQENGKLAKLRSGKTLPGSGPRHMVISPDGRKLYANNEMTLGVSVFDRNPNSGELSLVQTETTLPDCAPNDKMSTAAIRLHPRLPVLYVSNRGHHSITIFSIKTDGKLERMGIHMLDVNEPRDFAIDPSGKWIVVAGQNSGALMTLQIDQNTGLLASTEHRSKVSKPVCIAFMPAGIASK